MFADQLGEAVSGVEVKNLKGKRMYTDDELAAQLDIVEANIDRQGSKFWRDPKHNEAGHEMIDDLRRRFDL